QLKVEVAWAKARLVPPEEYEDAARRAGRRPPLGAARIAGLYARYEAGKRRQGAMDLDDLLWTCADLLEADPRYAAAVRWRHRHLFVDEMQDVNPAQYRLLGALLGPEPDLFVVGDPHQSVYGWNGADPSLLDRLPEAMPGTRVIRLDENHRSSPQVVAVAAAALGLESGGGPTSARRAGPVPRIVGHPTDHHEAAWVAREVWVAHRPGRRWAQLAVLARTNAQLQLVAGALREERVPHRFAGSDLAPGGAAGDPVGGDASGTSPGTSPVTAPWARTDGTGPGNAVGDREDAVVLSTFHRAKGLQWPAVFVVGLSDGLVPIASARTEAALEEERRLLYVALTRAEDELACTWTAHADHWQHESGAPPRRPSPWLAAMEGVRTALLAADVPPDPADVRARLDELRARLGAGDARPPG
ncbi:MAG: 3'-5' exonuclease, partial [Acidimicrobiales bacterium]